MNWKTVEFLYLNHDEVRENRPPYGEIVDVIETTLTDKVSGLADMPTKINVVPREEMYIHALPGYLKSLDVAGVKWQSNVIDNPSRGLPFNIGLVVLTNPADGAPRAVMDCTWITAIRTAAASLAAIRHLKPSRARVLAIIGLGVQGRTHLDAIAESGIPGELERIGAYDVSEDALAGFVEYARRRTAVEVEPCASPEAAVRGADVIITCTTFLKRSDPKVLPDWLKPGSLAVPVDVGSYWTPESRDAMDLIVTDDIPQTIAFAERGFFQGRPVRLDAEFGDVIAGNVPGRRSDDERIMCINAGLSLFDIGLAQKVYERARERAGAGTWLKW